MLPQPKSPQGHFTSMINHTWPDYKQYIKHENSHYSTDKYQNKIHKCNKYNIKYFIYALERAKILYFSKAAHMATKIGIENVQN